MQIYIKKKRHGYRNRKESQENKEKKETSYNVIVNVRHA
jgi:hypothetical protein